MVRQLKSWAGKSFLWVMIYCPGRNVGPLYNVGPTTKKGKPTYFVNKGKGTTNEETKS